MTAASPLGFFIFYKNDVDAVVRLAGDQSSGVSYLMGNNTGVFVHVFFNELPPGVAYSAGEIDTKISGMQGAIRVGRPLDVKQKLIKQISAAWSQITGQPEKQLLAGLSEINSDISI